MTVDSCKCRACVDACKHMPGWMTPLEATAAIEAGMARDLMMDWFEPDLKYGNRIRIFVLCPAAEDHRGSKAAEMDELFPENRGFMTFFAAAVPQRCVLLKKDRCSIHDSGFKPSQCKAALGCNTKVGLDKVDMIAAWDTDDGRALISRWEKLVDFKEK